MSNGKSFTNKFPIASVIGALPGNYLFLLPDDPHFTIVEATQEYCTTTQVRKEELIGRSIFEVFPEVVQPGENVDYLRHSLTEVLKTRQKADTPLHQYNIFNPAQNALEERFWTFTNVPVFEKPGEISLIIHKVVDRTVETNLRISERRAKEDSKAKSRFHQLLMQAPLAMCLLEGPDFVISSANDTILRLWNKTEEVIGRSLFQELPEFKFYQNSYDIIKAYKTGEIIYGYEERVTVQVDGEEREMFINYVCQPILEERGVVSGVLVMVYDVTRQVMAAKTVQESEYKLRSLIDQSHCAITFMTGHDLIIQIANKPALQTLNAGPEVIGKSLLEILPEPTRSRLRQRADSVFGSGKTYTGSEVRWDQAAGENESIERYFTYTLSPLREKDHGIEGAVIIATDVTDDVLIKRKLRDEEERLKAATEAAELGLWDYNMVTGQMAWDARCKELYGLPEDAMVDYNVFVARLHPEDRERVERMVSWASNPESRGTYDVEHRTVSDTERWVRSVGKVFFDDQQKPVRFIGTILDITDKKQEEIRKNDFTAMASHELKTPLTSVKAYIQILHNMTTGYNDSFLSNSLTKVDLQLNKMTKMINDFLDLSKMESGRLALNPERFELNDLIEEVQEEAGPLINTHTVSFSRHEDVYLFADRQKIGEVIQNFLSNAAKYSPNSKLITVKVTHDDIDVTVSVTDHGIGVSPDDQDRIFDRFFRSKKASSQGFSGFGIGLYIASEIIHRHNGTIGVKSEEDKGSEFYFTLPLSKTEIE